MSSDSSDKACPKCGNALRADSKHDECWNCRHQLGTGARSKATAAQRDRELWEQMHARPEEEPRQKFSAPPLPASPDGLFGCREKERDIAGKVCVRLQAGDPLDPKNADRLCASGDCIQGLRVRERLANLTAPKRLCTKCRRVELGESNTDGLCSKCRPADPATPVAPAPPRVAYVQPAPVPMSEPVSRVAAGRPEPRRCACGRILDPGETTCAVCIAKRAPRQQQPITIHGPELRERTAGTPAGGAGSTPARAATTIRPAAEAGAPRTAGPARGLADAILGAPIHPARSSEAERLPSTSLIRDREPGEADAAGGRGFDSRRAGPLQPHTEETMAETCNDPEGCDQPVKSKGKCSKHYQRWLKAGKPDDSPARAPSSEPAAQKRKPRAPRQAEMFSPGSPELELPKVSTLPDGYLALCVEELKARALRMYRAARSIGFDPAADHDAAPPRAS